MAISTEWRFFFKIILPNTEAIMTKNVIKEECLLKEEQVSEAAARAKS